MPGDMRDRVVVLQLLAQTGQGLVLGIFENLAFQSFKFNADRIVVAIALAFVLRGPCMPCAVVAADKLPETAVSADKEVGRDLQAAQPREIIARMLRASSDLNDYKIVLVNDRQDLEEHRGMAAGLLSIGLPPSVSRTLTAPLVELFGEHFIQTYAAIKDTEYREYFDVVSPWERRFLLLNV